MNIQGRITRSKSRSLSAMSAIRKETPANMLTPDVTLAFKPGAKLPAVVPTNDNRVYDYRVTQEPENDKPRPSGETPVIPADPEGSVYFDPRTMSGHQPRTVKSSVSGRGSLSNSKLQALEAQRRQVELDAVMENANIQKEVVNAKMAARLAEIEATRAAIEDEQDQGSQATSIHRVEEWLGRSDVRSEPAVHFATVQEFVSRIPINQEQRSTRPPLAAKCAPTSTPTAPTGASYLEPQNKPRSPYRTTRDPERPHTTEYDTQPIRRDRSIERRSQAEGLECLAEAITRMGRPRLRQTFELPRFDGNPADWIAFKRMYIKSTDVYGFAPYENMARLMNSLHGEAKAAVEDILRSSSDPREVMIALEEEFGHPGAILDCALQKIRGLPKLNDDGRGIGKFVTVVRNCVSLMRNVRATGYINNPQLVSELLMKLTPFQRARYGDYVKSRDSVSSVDLRVSPSLDVFLDFMSEQARAASYLAPLTFTGQSGARAAPAPNASIKLRASTAPRNAHRVTTVSTAANTAAADHKDCARKGRSRLPSSRPVKSAETASTSSSVVNPSCVCALCKGKHDLPSCKQFQELDVDERWNLVKDNKLCFKCIVKNHSREYCRVKRCDQCNAPHHALLHYSRSEPVNVIAAEPSVELSIEPSVEQVTSVGGHSASALLKIVPITIVQDGGEVNTYALLDDGATVSLLDSSLVPGVNSDSPVCPLTIVTARGQCVTDLNSRKMSIRIRGPNSAIHSVVVRSMTGLDLPGQVIPTDIIRRNAHLRGLDCSDNLDCGDRLDCSDSDCRRKGEAKPMLLLGQDNWQLIVGREIRQGKSGQPVASLTLLGWVIHGPLGSHCEFTEKENCMFVRDSDLHALVKNQFELEAIGILEVSRKNVDTERANQILEQTSRRVSGGWEVGLLWKREKPEFPDNYEYARKRLLGIERRMDRDREFSSAYESQINRLVNERYASKLDRFPIKTVMWYLPHFGVTNPNKPGKLRLVFDAAANFKGTSLNGNLLSGPDLLNSLFGVLLRFRLGPVAIKADITDMFLRVSIRSVDRGAQMFLWRGRDRTRDPDTYVMNSMIFGATSSPASAIYVLNKNADEFVHSHPDAVRAIHCNHYMDDYLDSMVSDDVARKLMNDVTEIHAAGGFHIRGWVTNSPTLRAEIATVAPPSVRMENINDLTIERTLGLIWTPEDDRLGFDVSLKRMSADLVSGTVTPTKREFLRAVMSIYDPLGFLCAAIIPTRILMQQIWRSGIDWDDQLLDREAEAWHRWIANLPSIANFKVPRWCGLQPGGLELHVFGDASEQAYAAVAYLVGISDQGQRHCALVAAKARVAPLKVISVPRLELQAAVLAVRLANTISNELNIARKFMWTDSRTVLSWIKSDARDFQRFVSHRLSEIERKSERGDWRWTPTADNPADEATRLGWPREHSIWVSGPSFLCNPQDLWPAAGTELAIPPEADAERVHSALTVAEGQPPLVDVTRFSSWGRAVRVTARALAFVRRCQGRQSAALTRADLNDATELLLMQSQRNCFGPEMAALRAGLPLPSGSRLRSLDPMLYEDGLLRIRGRLKAAAELSFDERHPVVLDGRDLITRLLVDDYHRRGLHANHEQIINHIRERYWVTRLRPTVKAIVASCQHCRIAKAQPSTPKMADLPPDRLTSTRRAFVHCGVDYFGPMEVVIGRRKEKRWGVLFTCLATRAVHLELAASLNVDSVILAIRRLTARRGQPALLRSDRGTNFVGADNELRAALREFDHDRLAEEAVNRKIQWIFNSPAAPHTGGVWERLVRSVKNALRITLKERAPKEEVLHTFLLEAELTVNSRPLTYVTDDPANPVVLTPNHLLLGTAAGDAPFAPDDPTDLDARRQWRRANALADVFWARWRREYLPTLQRRGKWMNDVPPVAVGNIVLICDNLVPRNQWPKGVIKEVYRGSDGRIRNVDIRTVRGTLRRSVARIVVLPTDASVLG